MSTDQIIPTLEGQPFIKKLLFLLFIIAVCLLISMVLGIVLAVPFFGLDVVTMINQADFISHPTGVRLLKFFQAVNQIGVFVLPAFFFGYLVNRKPLQYLHLNHKFTFLMLSLSLVLIVVSIPGINLMVELNEKLRLPYFLGSLEKWMRHAEDQAKLLTDVFLRVNTLKGLLVNLFIIAFLASIGEELLFRGVILRLLNEFTGNIHIAVILSAVLFSALHMQFYGFLPRTALGILFGYLFVWSGSLWVPIILHFVFNGISVVAAYLYETGAIRTDVNSLGTNQGSLVISVSIILSAVLIYILFRYRKKEFQFR
jgi:uncharacterized protein